MKSIFIIILFSIFGLADEFNDYFKSKDYLKSVTFLNSYVTDRSESFLGSNLISISLINKNNEKVSFKILKDQPIIITDCDFKILKNGENFIFSIDSECNELLSKEAQNRYVFDILKSIDTKIKFMYNKGDL